MTRFTITDRAHQDCERCDQAADDAIVHARVTGSTGATYNVDTLSSDLTVTDHHSATVTRTVHPEV